MPENGKESQKAKMPDFIYVDEVHQRENELGTKPNYFENLKKINKSNYPFFLRILTLFVAFILLFWMICISFILVIVSLFSIVTFFKVDQLNNYLKQFWKLLRRISAFCLALFVATLSPSFGLGILTLYLMMQGENLESSFMSRILSKKSFN